MKRVFFLALLSAIIFMNCSPKTGEKVVQESKDVTKSMSKEAWRANAPAPAAARSIELGEYSSFDMNNGLKVIVVENHKLPRVSYQLTLLNDPVSEGDQAGYQDLAGQLLKQGTETKSKAEIDEAVDFIGASFNTRRGGIYGSSLKKHSGALLDIMTDVLYHPSFPQSEFDKLITQSRSGLTANNSDPQAMVGNVAAVVNYGKNHPYGEVETVEKLDNIKLSTIKNYYNTYFKPNNAFLIIVGDINQMEAKAQAQKYFGDWKSGKIPSSSYDMPEMPSETKVAIANKDGAVQSVIRVTYPVNLKPGDDDNIAADVMNNILGGGVFSGRLMQNLREDKAYTYGARSSLRDDKLVGNFNAYASVRNEVTDSSVHEFLYEMERIATEPVNADDLQLVKNSMSGSFARSLESPQTIARFAYNIYRYGLPADYYNTYLQKLDAVSVSDVQAMAKKYIRPDNANIVVVGAADEISKGLLQFDGDGKIDYYSPTGEMVERKKVDVGDVTGKDIIKDYIKAIGGKDKLNSVKSLFSLMKMSIMGQESATEMYQMKPDKFAMKVTMSGNVVQEQKYDGMKGYVGGMGGSQVVSDPEQLAQMKKQASMFGELDYLNDDYTLNIKGVEALDGADHYKVEVIDPDGDKSYQYFNKATKLLRKVSKTEEGQDGNPMTIETEFMDYKSVDGIMLPFSMKITGAMPFPLDMKAEKYEVNPDIPASTFMIK